MNEELKIIIKAVNDSAKKAIKEVRDELEKTKESAKKGSKSISDSMKSVAKGAAVAVGAITAVTAALVNLGKGSAEAQKEIGKLISAFQSAGSTAEQAKSTYVSLYGFLGDSGAATEAAQSLARLTTDTKALSEWTNILQGVYARAGSAIPVEGLAEAANETANTGKLTGNLVDALVWLGVSEDEFNAKLATTNSLQEREALIRSTLNGLYGNAANMYAQNNQALIAYNQSQAQVTIAMAQASNAVLPLLTALNNLSVSLLTNLRPAIAVVCQMLAILVGWIQTAVGWITSFFSLFSGGGSKAKDTTKSVADNVSGIANNSKKAVSGVGGLGGALNKAAKAAKDLKKQTMGFDELNVVSSPDAAASAAAPSGGAAGGGGGISVPDLSGLADFEMPDLTQFKQDLEEARGKAQALLVLIGLVALGIAAFKLTTFIQELALAGEGFGALTSALTVAGGWLLIIAGSLLLVTGYTDAWVNGIDWGNFSAILAGIGAIVGGVALAFGTLAAGIAMVTGGIALIVIGIKDFITNGYTMQAILAILAGVILVVVGVCLAFNAALLANPITWIILAIAALVAAFVILWNECEGFRNFWIAIWEYIKQAFSAFVESIQPLIDAIVRAFKEAWELIKVIWNDYLVPLFKAAWEAIKAVWDFVKPYFEMIWNNIKIIFSVVVDILGGYFKAAWEVIKIVWDTVVSYFTAIWDSIAGVFSVVKNVLSGNWSEAWEGIKGIVNTWAEFFSGVWDSIKKIFAVVGNFFKDAFGTAWQGVKDIFANVGSFFSGVWDTIKGIFSKVGTAIADGIKGAVTGAVNKVLSTAVKIINGFISAINTAISIINAIPGVNIKKLNKLDVPKMAKGGIVDTATIAMIGEAGKEAVVPLENNTQWMDALAEKIAARHNPTKVILKVGEKELGWATIDAINGITEQTGGLQLAL